MGMHENVYFLEEKTQIFFLASLAKKVSTVSSFVTEDSTDVLQIRFNTSLPHNAVPHRRRQEQPERQPAAPPLPMQPNPWRDGVALHGAQEVAH